MSSEAPSELKRNTPADELLHDVSLRPLNTFGINVHAERYYRATSVSSIQQLLAREQPALVLGGGSNVLLTKDVEGLVLHVDIRGRETIRADESAALVEAGAGENWHEFVLWTLGHDLGGLENLSLIPGSVGATPIQNIGAYGVEIKDNLETVRAVNRETREEEVFDASELQLGYRDSVFKRELKERYIITHVRFRLTQLDHKLNTDYGDIRASLTDAGEEHNIQSVSRAVIGIRQSKLPDPALIGNSGSFFKNPVIDADAFAKLKARRPDVRFYELPDGTFKIPAGWLIEQAGWKGHRRGNIGVHDRQALVLVNHGEGHGHELWGLAQEILADVKEKFGVDLVPEVNVI